MTHVYRIKWGQRVFCVIFMAFACVFLGAVLWGIFFSEKEVGPWTIFIGFALVAGGGLLTAEKFMTAVTLTEKEVRLRSGYADQKLPIDRIRCRRRYFAPGDGESAGEWRLKIVSDDDRFPTLDFDERYTFDEEFHAWFNRLPDLDESDKHAPEPSNLGLV
jgi:hypothetical protein